MTDQPEQPRNKRQRRRAAVSSGHSAVVPASVGQGAQLDAGASAKPTKRRGRKRDAGAAPAETEAALAMPVVPAQGVTPEHEPTNRTERRSDHGTQTDQDVTTVEPVQVESVQMESVQIGSMRIESSRDESVPIEMPAPIAVSPAATAAESESEYPAAALASFPDAASAEAGGDHADHGEQDASAARDPGSAGDDIDGRSAELSGRRSGENPPREPPTGPVVEARHHRWVYATVALFLLSLAFGLWGVWATFFAGAGDSGEDAGALRQRNERLSQEISTLRRSDQISRDANRDLQRTLAERDEEIAGLRADVAFYERFVGATGQRRGLSVHDLDMRLENGRAWRFVATLTQNLNRGAVNDGRLTLAIEGTRNGRLERLSWTQLRQQNNAPGQAYSFKYFQQVEGNVILPEGFEPLRVTVRLVPAGGSAVEQSFPWADTVAADAAG